MNQAEQRHLQLLTEIAERQDVTQRGLSKSLGIALGLTNLYLKRLVRKGYVKATTIPPNRIRYLLTPQGISEKTRLTYEFISLSLTLYKQTREKLREALRPAVSDGLKRIVLYGTGEAAELAYLTLKEFGLEPVAVYAESTQTHFLGLPVLAEKELSGASVDRVIVASFAPMAARQVAELRRLVPDEKLIFLNERPV